MENAVLKIENLSFEYPAKPVFQGIDLVIPKGSLFTLLGPNGCGKTTLLHCILNFLKPYQGSIFLGGQNITEMKTQEIAKKVAYVPQSHKKMFAYTVLEIVLMGRVAYTPAYSSPKQEDIAIAHDALQAVGINHLADKPYIHLSGGESQLVLLARAIAQCADMIMLDEPTAHLDSYHEMMVLDKLAELILESSLTVIMTTHFPNQAFHFINQGVPVHGALMKNGEIMISGTGEEIFTKDTISSLYNIKSKLVVFEDDNGRPIKQIIPLGLDHRQEYIE